MMPIRMQGNCRLRCENDKLPALRRGPSSETSRHEVTAGLRVLSAVDLDHSCLLERGEEWRGIEARCLLKVRWKNDISVG